MVEEWEQFCQLRFILLEQELLFLNHAEHPLTTSQVVASINQAEKMGLITILCADSIKEARMLAMLNPTIMLCEPTELIGTGQTVTIHIF